MRFPIGVAAAAMLGAVSAWGQDKPTVPTVPAAKGSEVTKSRKDNCAALKGKLNGLEIPGAFGKLFIWREQNWQSVDYQLVSFWEDFTLKDYRGEKLSFIYAAGARTEPKRRFLSIRTVAKIDDPDDYVNLRKHHDEKGDVLYETYQDYHRDQKPIAVLRRYHSWPDGSRSDRPPERRSSWTFQTRDQPSRHRVLGISYLPAADRAVCVPFFLGPNIATPNVEYDGADHALLGQKGFTIEVTEVKNDKNSAGRTFTIRSPRSGS